MNEKFIKMLSEAKDDDLEKPKGKRGRPKKEKDEDGNETDGSGKEGVRTVTLIAKIKIDGEKKEETKTLKDIDTKDIDDEIDKWEKALNKKYNYDADITITKKIGDYDVDDDATKFMTKDSSEGDEEDEYEIGRVDK